MAAISGGLQVECGLSPLQRALYKNILAKNAAALNLGVTRGIARTSLLNVLMALRKACQHPFLFPGQEPEVCASPLLQERVLVWRLQTQWSPSLRT